MAKNNERALKAGIWYTIGNFLIKGMGFLSTPIFSRLLSMEELGNFSNVLTWVGVLAVITSLDLYSSISVARFDYKDKLDEFISSNLILGFVFTCICYGVTYLCKDFFLPLMEISEFELHMMYIYLLTYSSLQMFQAKNQVEYKYKSSLAVSITSAVISTGGSLLCTILFSDRLLGRMLGYFVPMIMLNMCVFVYLIFKGKKCTFSCWKYALAISLPLVLHLLAGNLLNSSDRIMITKICGAADNALYSVAYSCALIVQILWISMNSAWAPWSIEQMNEKRYEVLKSASRPYLLFFGVVVFFFLMVAPEVLWLMGGEPYMNAVGVIPPVMIGYVFQFLYTLYVNVETYLKKQIFIAFGTIIATLSNIVLNFLLIPKFGYIAAAYTTLISYIILFGVHFLVVLRYKRTWWYDTKFILLYSICSLAFLAISLFLYRYSFIRYILIGIIVIGGSLILFVIRKELIVAFKEKSILPVKNSVLEMIRRQSKSGNE